MTVIIKIIPVYKDVPFDSLLLKVFRHYMMDCIPRWFRKCSQDRVSFFFCLDWPWQLPSFTFPMTDLEEKGLRAEGADLTLYCFGEGFQLPMGWSGYPLDRVGFVKVFPATVAGEEEIKENLRVLHLEDNETNRKLVEYRKFHPTTHELVHMLGYRSDYEVPLWNVDLVRVSDLQVFQPGTPDIWNEWLFSVQRFPYSDQDPFPRRFIT